MISRVYKILSCFYEKKEAKAKVKNKDVVLDIDFYSPKGLFSKVKDETGIVFNEKNKIFVIPLQKPIEEGTLENGDVILTDDKNYIHFKFEDGKIEIKGDTIFNDNVTIKGNLEVEGDIKVKGDVAVDKDVKVTGDVEGQNMKAKNKVEAVNVEATADVTAGTVKLSKHNHQYMDTTPVGDIPKTTLPPTP